VPKTWAKESGKNVGKGYTNKKNRDINIINNKNWDVSKQNWICAAEMWKKGGRNVDRLI
jgi:hypothetical protein